MKIFSLHEYRIFFFLVKLDCIVFHWIKKAPKQTSHDSVKVTRFHKIFFLGSSKSLAPLNMFLGLKVRRSSVGR